MGAALPVSAGSHRSSVLIKTAQQETWQVSRQYLDSWRCWDGEIVVYDHRSGDTMKLDIIMSAVFRFILRKPATQGAITEHLSETLDLTIDKQLNAVATMALRRLRQAALIEPASTPEAPGAD